MVEGFHTDAGQVDPDPLMQHVAGALDGRLEAIAAAWVERGAGGVAEGRDNPDGARPHDVLRALVRVVGEGPRRHDEQVMRIGWAVGTVAFWRDASLHQLLKELDGALTLLMSEADAALRTYEGQARASDGLGLARRLVDAMSLLRLAAAGGYTRVMTDELRRRYRTIRHDLRNPLGTITTAVALMDDETIPSEARHNPRVRAMVARNARSLSDLIATVLGDSAARIPGLALQTASLREVACAVRGDLNAALDGVTIEVDDAMPTFPFDSAGIELLVKAAALAVVRPARTPITVAIELASLAQERAGVRVVPRGGGTDPALVDVAFARELAMRLGGAAQATPDGGVLVEFPVERSPLAAGVPDAPTLAPADAPAARSVADERNHVGGAGERVDLEAGRL